MNAENNINNTNYTIKAAENVVMNANNINNIHADSNYSAATGATTNETRIEAGNIVSLNATKDSSGNGGNITNIGATIKAGNLLYLTADNDITNAALVNYKINGSATNADGSAITEAQALASNANSITSTLVSQGNIESGGNVVLVAGNNLNNIGSNITATGAAYLEATNGDINITTAQLRDRSVTSGGKKKKAWTKTEETITNIQSNITSSGDLDLASLASDINIKGSNLTAADNLTLTAKDDITIESAQNSSYSFAAGRTGRGKSYLNKSSSTTQIESNLTTTNNGNISITAGYLNTDAIGDTNSKGNLSIIASNLTTKDINANTSDNVGTGNIALTAKENLVIASALNSTFEEKSSSKKGNSYKKSTKDITIDDVNISSDLNASGDIKINSGGNAAIIASNLTGTNGEIIVGKYLDSVTAETIVNDSATLTIASGQDRHYKFHEETKIKTDQAAVVIGAAVAIAAVALAAPTGGASLVLLAGAGATGAAVGAEGKRGRTLTNETTEISQKMSVLNFNADLNIQSASDTAITASKLTADNAVILTGKFRDLITDEEIIARPDAQLKINSALNTYDNKTTVRKITPNYATIAIVSAAAALSSYKANQAILKLTGSQALAFLGGSAASNAITYSASLTDSILNIKHKKSYSDYRETEIKTELHFNNLTTE
jgi:hypothetical protein